MKKAGMWTLLFCMVFASFFTGSAVFAAELSVQFNYTGSAQTWQVPPDVTLVKIEAWGAEGGIDAGHTAGLGGYAFGTKSVTPGSTLTIMVGGAGIGCTSGAGGGFNGGGNAGPGGCSGGGGGASDVRVGGTDISNRILVAGGGGGAGLYGNGGPGGGNGPFLGIGAVGNHPGDGGGGGGGYQGGYYGYYDLYYQYYGLLYAYDSGGAGGSSYIGGVVNGGTTPGVNSGNGRVKITIVDNIAPTATVSYSQTGPTNQDVIATITPSEPIVGATSYTFTENGSYTFHFTDLAGNAGSVTANVANIDKVAPTLTVQADKATLSPPNHKLVDVELSWNPQDAGSGIANVKLISVTSNEPDNGLGDGDTANDIQGTEYGTADQSIQLRAERSGNGNDRVYTIIFEATDSAGNHITASTTVTVPHSAKK